MTTDANNIPRDSEVVIDLLDILKAHSRLIFRAAIGVTLLTAIVGGWYLLFQPTRRTAIAGFRPSFTGADAGRYPNGTSFGTSDIIGAAVIDQVFDKNQVKDFCSREAFRAGFTITQDSADFASLDADYKGRLAEARITAVERERLLTEYKEKRRALPANYQLAYVEQPGCKPMSALMMAKVVADVLATWADDAESKRGVLNLDVQILTPGSFELGSATDDSLLIRADLVRNALQRLENNVDKVSNLPGANLVRLGEKRTTFLEVRVAVDGLIQSKLDPIIVAAGQGLGRDSLAWVSESLATAIREQQAMEGRAKAYLDALREYSGTTATPVPGRAEQRQGAGMSPESQSAPQIDREFIDRLIEMSSQNVVFRQELTRQMVFASVSAVGQEATVSHYQRLADQLRKPGASGLTPREVADRLDAIITEAKALAKTFNELYEEFSRLSLRTGSSLYQADGPTVVGVDRAWSLRSYLVTVVGAFVTMLVLMAAGCLLWKRFFVRHTPAAV